MIIDIIALNVKNMCLRAQDVRMRLVCTSHAMSAKELQEIEVNLMVELNELNEISLQAGCRNRRN